MKKLAILLAVVAVIALVSAPAFAATKYGKGVSETTPVKLSELMAKPDDYVGKVVVLDEPEQMAVAEAPVMSNQFTTSCCGLFRLPDCGSLLP